MRHVLHIFQLGLKELVSLYRDPVLIFLIIYSFTFSIYTPSKSAVMDVVNASEIALVVTELYLPVGQSRCLARTIAKSPALRRTKILAYTTHGRREDRAWARRIGADGYVITRSGEERFLSVVDTLMVDRPMPRRTTRRRPKPS